MWRLARGGGLGDGAPSLYLSIARRCGSRCALAELDGELVGFAIMQPPARHGSCARLLQLCLAPSLPALETAAALMGFLLGLAPFAGAEAVDIGASCCPPRVLRSLQELAHLLASAPAAPPTRPCARPVIRKTKRGRTIAMPTQEAGRAIGW